VAESATTEAARTATTARGTAIAGLRRFEGRAMASRLSLALSGQVPNAVASEAWAAVTDEFEASEDALSRFRLSSELTALNQAAQSGTGLVVGARLRRALVAADRAHRITCGRFDPRVLRALDRLGYRGAPLATQAAEPEGRRNASDPDRPVAALDRRGLVRASTPIDLGGIGKGLALRWSARRVAALLPIGTGFLLDAGGDITTAGPGPVEGAWMVAIEDPAGQDQGPVVVALSDGALATSSVRVHRWQDAGGGSDHHLLDPFTGRPGGDGLLSVTVAGPDPAWAEVRSKELFVAGSTRIAHLGRSLGLAAWWIDGSGHLGMTPAARLRTAWVADEGRSGP
jgi:thiamine biosynthesis lipoprotein